MTKLQKIEDSVRALDQEEFRAFADWFANLQADRWDRQIEADARGGRLDKAIAQARTEIANGGTRPL